MEPPVTGDPDIWTEIQPEGSRRLLLAALEIFSVRGYSATTTRQITQVVGMSPGALYVHYKSKSDLLYAMSWVGHNAVLNEVRLSLVDVDGAAARLQRLMSTFVAWHARNHTLARVIQFELGALSSDQFAEIKALRAEFERVLSTELDEGIASEAFTVPDPAATRLALLSLGIDVARWWRPAGLSPDALGSAYAALALRIVGARDPVAQ